MNKLTVNFLQLLVLLLSIGSLESTQGGHGVQAAPVSSGAPSRRGSTLEPLSNSEVLAARSRKARIGVKTGGQSAGSSANSFKASTKHKNKSSSKSTTKTSDNFPTVKTRSTDCNSTSQKRDDDADSSSSGFTVALQKLNDNKTSQLHPQLRLQHHMNLANAKLDRMRQRSEFTKDDQTAALTRRRDSLMRRGMEPMEDGSILAARSKSGRVGHGGSQTKDNGQKRQEAEELEARRVGHAAGRQGVVINTKTGFAGKPDNGKRDSSIADQPHNLVPVQAAQDEASSSSSPTTTKAKSGHEHNAAATPTTTSSAKTSCSTSTSKSNKASAKKNAAAAASSTYDIAAQGYPTAALSASNQDGLINATTPDTKGSLALDIEANDVGYVAVFDIGTAGQFRLLVDSGSADTWVASTACKGCSKNHKQLGPSTSSSFKSITPQTPFSITYGTGSVSGHLGNDTLKIAEYQLKSHTFGLATKESDDFSDDSVPFDGLMGLAQQSLSSSGTVTPIDGLYQDGAVPQPVMGYHLDRAADGNNSGEVTFGGVNAEKYTGNLVEMENVSQSGFWEATLEAVSFDGKEIDFSSLKKSTKSSKRASTSRTAILDTGTTLIVAPQADADALHSAIPGATSDGQGGYTIPCTTAKQVSFKFGGTDWKMDPRDMIFLPVDENNLKGDCVSAISAGTVGQKGEWLVGAAFLKNVYFATNTKSNTLALGHLA